MNDLIVSQVDKARFLLSQASDAASAKKVMDIAHAAEIYARRQRLSDEAIGYARSIKVDAQRLLGDFLSHAELADGGDARRGSLAQKARLTRPTESHPKLKDVGITKQESYDSQVVARFAKSKPETFQDFREGRVTLKNLIKEERQEKQAAERGVAAKLESRVVTDLSSLSGQKFGCIYVDPPWQYQNQATRASTDNHYKTMTVEAICAMPVGELASQKSHLHLWTTNAFLFECPRIFKAWGFDFKSSFVWVKPEMGIGNYWRNSHEILLLAVRGGQTAISHSEKSWLEVGRGSHSAKPFVMREILQRLSPGPYLELFGRYPANGWTVFGDQVATDILIP